MILRKLVAVILVTVAFLFISKSPALAVIKTSGDLRVTFDDPLFGSTIWYPGLEKSAGIKVENTGLVDHDVLIQAINTSQTGGMADQYRMKVVQDGNLLWGWDTMQHFWDLGEHEYGFIPKGQWKNYDFYVSLPGSVGNGYQGKSAAFDLRIGFKGQDSSVTTSSDNNSSGGTVAGAATDTGGDSGWTENPQVLGAAQSTDSGNGTTSGKVGAYEERVLGSNACKSCFWWPILVVEGLILLVYLLVVKKSSWLFPLVVSFTAYLVFLWFNRTCTNWTSISCKLFWLWDLLILLAWSLAKKFYPGK